MIYNYSISPEKKIVRITADGNYSIANIKNLVELITKDDRYMPDFNSIVDIRKVKYTPVVSEIMEFSDFILTMKNSFKAKVVLVVNGELLYNLFNLSANHSNKNGIRFDIFTDIEKAKNWIDS
ncbi:MAG: hypothetical protein J7L71_03305 [Spirochaetaceae bacterium]|nr:hypothetical protein [Spirochaetaceae bacterium]